MKGLIMFPVVVLILCTLISFPAFWGADVTYSITRTVTDDQLTEITDSFNDYQDTYGYDQPAWDETAIGYYESLYAWVTEDKATVTEGMATQLNNTFHAGSNEALINIHELMAGEMADLLWELGDPSGSGDYATREEINNLIDIEPYLTSECTYEQNLVFSREVSEEQLDTIYASIVAFQYEYGADSWFEWRIKGHRATAKMEIYTVLNDLFDYEQDEDITDVYSNTAHSKQAEQLAEKLHDAGEVITEADLLSREEVFKIVKVDPDFYNELSYLNDRGLSLSTSLIWVGLFTGIIVISLIAGLKIFDSGISDASINVVITLVSYYAVWGILSIGSSSIIRDTAIIGVPIWVMLTLMFTMGVLGNITGESA